MEKLLKLILYIVNLPLHLLSSILPKSKDVWIFGAWFGDRYSDNSRYLFEYVSDFDSEIDAIWLTRDSNLVQSIRKKGYKAYTTYSFMGYLKTMLCGVGVTCTGKGDVNNYVFAGSSKLVNLWHGTALKKIMYDDKITFKSNRFLSNIFPFLGKTEYDLICAPSEEVKRVFTSAFRVDSGRVVVTGNPRNDSFGKKNKRLEKEGLKGVYMPTHRSEGSVNFVENFISWADKITDTLNEYKITLYVKLHYYHSKELINYGFNSSCVVFVQDSEIDNDVYSFISDKDFLITDYSSIYFDFLITDRPIIFFPYDKEDYLTKDRELYYNYNDVTPGPKVYEAEALKNELAKIANGVDKYKKERKRVNSIFNNFYDGENSKRVYEQIKLLLDR